MRLRAKRAFELVEWVGTDKLTLVDAATGWPSYFDCKVGTQTVRIALYLSKIGLTHRGRDDRERRFQNPSKASPVSAPKEGEMPFMLGMTTEFEGQRTLVGMDAYRRIGKDTRQSLFAPLSLLKGVVGKQWLEDTNAKGERLIAFVPELLPRFVENYRANGGPPGGQGELDF